MGHENARERTCGDSVGAGGLRGPPRPGSVFQGACAPAQRASSVAGRRRGRRAPGRAIPGLAPSPRLKEDAVTGIGHTLA